MVLYRLAKKPYVKDLSGTGAQLYGGRWNPQGMACLYTSMHVSLALLERFVHAQGTDDMGGLMLLELWLDDGEGIVYHMDESRFEAGWAFDFEYSKWLGQQVLSDPDILAFSVPSVIVPNERNVVVNPLAAERWALEIKKCLPFVIDERLLGHLAKNK